MLLNDIAARLDEASWSPRQESPSVDELGEDQERLAQLCCHEAAHAVVQVADGHEVLAARVSGDGRDGECVSLRGSDPWRGLVGVLAGEAFDEVFMGLSPDPDSHDAVLARRIAGEVDPENVDDVIRVASLLARRRVRELERPIRVAAVLLRWRGELGAAALRSIVGDPRRPSPHGGSGKRASAESRPRPRTLEDEVHVREDGYVR
jgi:hypothetical protein